MMPILAGAFFVGVGIGAFVMALASAGPRLSGEDHAYRAGVAHGYAASRQVERVREQSEALAVLARSMTGERERL